MHDDQRHSVSFNWSHSAQSSLPSPRPVLTNFVPRIAPLFLFRRPPSELAWLSTHGTQVSGRHPIVGHRAAALIGHRVVILVQPHANHAPIRVAYAHLLLLGVITPLTALTRLRMRVEPVWGNLVSVFPASGQRKFPVRFLKLSNACSIAFLLMFLIKNMVSSYTCFLYIFIRCAW